MAALLEYAARLQIVADELTGLLAEVQQTSAQGLAVDDKMLRDSYRDACDSIRNAQSLRGPIEPEILAAIMDLQRAKDALEDLLA